MVIETSRPVAIVAKELGINESTLGNWVNLYRREHAGEEPPLSVSERVRLRESEREIRELKMQVEWSQRTTQQKSTNGARSAGGSYRSSVNLVAAAPACSTPAPIGPAVVTDGEFTPPRVAVAFVQDTPPGGR